MADTTGLPSPKPLTDEQRKLVKATVPVLEQHGSAITRLFYKQMLEENPELRNIFNHTKQQVRMLSRACLIRRFSNSLCDTV